MAKAIIIACMDPRLVRPVADLIDEMGLENHCYDPKPAGGIKCLATGESEERRTCCGYIDLVHAKGKGPAEDIILSAHTNCAAYASVGSRFIPAQLQDEIRFLTGEIEKASKYVSESFPKMRIIRRIIFVLDGDLIKEIIDL